MARLRRADCSGPGITRASGGRGFAYYDDGERVDDPEVLARIRELGDPARLAATSGSARTRTATCRRRGSTPRGASSTATTTLAHPPRRRRSSTT